MVLKIMKQEVQHIVHKIVETARQSYRGWMMQEMPDGIWDILIESYFSNNQIIASRDKQFGPGASQYIGRAIQYYFHKQTLQE